MTEEEEEENIKKPRKQKEDNNEEKENKQTEAEVRKQILLFDSSHYHCKIYFDIN